MVLLDMKLSLPDGLAKEAQDAGLLTPEAIEELLRVEIRKRRADKLFAAADILAELDVQPMTVDEIEAEIQAARAEKRGA